VSIPDGNAVLDLVIFYSVGTYLSDVYGSDYWCRKNEDEVIMPKPKHSQSKYAGIVPGLPELPVNADWQAKLDLVKTKMTNDGIQTPQQLLAHYRALRAQQDVLKAQQSEVYLALEATTQLLIDSNLRQEDGWGAYGQTPNTLIAASGDRVRIDVEPFASIVDADANRRWAIKEGLERLLSLPWSTLNALTKKRLLAGESEPPGVKTFKKRTIVFTQVKAEEEPQPVEEWSPDADGVDVPF